MLQIISGLAEGQVIQRITPVHGNIFLNLSGKARGAVTATLRGKNQASLKGWAKKKLASKTKETAKVELRGVPAGGPYQLTLECGNAQMRIESFYVGDVWILAGQSNMEGHGLVNSAPKKHPLIRAFSMRREWRAAAEPLHLISESPDACHNGGNQCSPEEGGKFRRTSSIGTGPGLFFAYEMLKKSGVPQGLICTAHGGTSMTDWTPEPIRNDQVSIYGSMLASVRATHQPVAGVLWYQGESDAGVDAAPLYTERMKLLVKNIRRDLRQPELPWIMVQIANVYGTRTLDAEKFWNRIQDQQRQLPTVIKNLGVVAAVDLTLDDNIHISGEGHAILGKRLAREADRLVYKNRRELPPPSLKSISYIKTSEAKGISTGPVAEVTFAHVVPPLQAAGVPNGFSIVDDEGKDLRGIFKTTLLKDAVRLHLGTNILSSKLSHGHGCVPVCNITDARGHALPVFGPQTVGEPKAYLPFITTWKTHEPVPLEEKLDQIKTPPTELPKGEIRTYVDEIFHLDGFINEHSNWVKHYGLAFFSSSIQLSEPMRLEFLMGYDGPFRLWIDGKSFFIDMNGINPCLPDESGKSILLSAGTHRVDVGMDINRGQAWGFFVRMIRQDLKRKQITSGDYAKPVYSA